MKGKLLALACVLTLAGCANGFADFYHQAPGADPARIAATRLSPPPSTPQVGHWSGTPDEAYRHFGELGYSVIGYSSFNGGRGTEAQAIEQGKKVHADLVVVMDPRYTGTRSTVVPIVTPTSQTSVTNGTATAYGTGRYATVYGTATTTTYGTQTNLVPISTDRFDFGAIYMVKAKMYFGAFFRDLTDEERQSLGSNRGVYVMTVVNDSPAFNADVLAGDVIVTVNGERVSTELLRARLDASHGKTVMLGIHRASGDVEKRVTLNN